MFGRDTHLTPIEISYIIKKTSREFDGGKYDVSILDSSLPAVSLYEHRGYKTVGHGFYELENNVRLVYEIMEKDFGNDNE